MELSHIGGRQTLIGMIRLLKESEVHKNSMAYLLEFLIGYLVSQGVALRGKYSG